jgi:hypothetical protein
VLIFLISSLSGFRAISKFVIFQKNKICETNLVPPSNTNLKPVHKHFQSMSKALHIGARTFCPLEVWSTCTKLDSNEE